MMHILLAVIIFCTQFFIEVTANPANQEHAIRKQFKQSIPALINHLIKGAARGSGLRWLEPLVDDFGNRHLCSQRLESAINFTLDRLHFNEFDNVHAEEVRNLPKWIRDAKDSAIMLEPRQMPLDILAIMGTGLGLVKAPVVVLSDLDQLESVNVSGKIVLFAQEWQGYQPTVRYRKSAVRVQRMGAVGLLVKSVTPFSLSTLHTGSAYTNSTIPAACITLEQAELLKRLYNRGKHIVVQMDIGSRHTGTCTSRNVVFDIKGSTHPEEIVLLSAHMDSWDLGQGALDDGGGMAAVWQAMDVLKAFGKLDRTFVPKRTIRAVFWTAEEQGLLGAEAYFEAHKNGDENFVFVSETDQGAFRPETYNSALQLTTVMEKHHSILQEIVQMLNIAGIPLSVAISDKKVQGDVEFWAAQGITAVNYCAERGIDYYFNFHHSSADYLSVFRDGDIDYTAAIFATLAHTIANIDEWP